MNLFEQEFKNTNTIGTCFILKYDKKYTILTYLYDRILMDKTVEPILSTFKPLFVTYKNIGSEEVINIDLNDNIWCVGNELFSSAFVRRCLEYQNNNFQFSMNYVIEIMDNNTNLFSLKSNQYMEVLEDTIEIKQIDQDDESETEPKPEDDEYESETETEIESESETEMKAETETEMKAETETEMKAETEMKSEPKHGESITTLIDDDSSTSTQDNSTYPQDGTKLNPKQKLNLVLKLDETESEHDDSNSEPNDSGFEQGLGIDDNIYSGRDNMYLSSPPKLYKPHNNI